MKLKQKYLNWLDKETTKALWVHKSKKNRMIFSLYYWLFMFVILLILIGSIVIIYFGGLSFLEDGGYQLKTPHNDAYLAIGSILFIIGCLIGIIGNVYLCYLFNRSRDKFFQSNEFLEIKKEINKSDLSKKSRKELKWLKKLGFISKNQFQVLSSNLKKK